MHEPVELATVVSRASVTSCSNNSSRLHVLQPSDSNSKALNTLTRAKAEWLQQVQAGLCATDSVKVSAAVTRACIWGWGCTGGAVQCSTHISMLSVSGLNCWPASVGWLQLTAGWVLSPVVAVMAAVETVFIIQTRNQANRLTC